MKYIIQSCCITLWHCLMTSLSYSADQDDILIGVLVPLFIIVTGAVVAALFLYIFHKRRPHTFTMFLSPANKEPVYEEPRIGNGIPTVELQREESIYSGTFAPSTIGEDKIGSGPYGTMVHLSEKPTDQEGFV